MNALTRIQCAVTICAAAAMLAGCGGTSGTGSMIGSTVLPSTQHIVPQAAGSPKITRVSRVRAKQTQRIVISGTGFGTMQPYDGDSGYIKIRDNTAGWDAGYTGTSEYDAVFLNVTSWSNHKIVIAGFTGAYGDSYWYLSKGDSLTISVWNAQTGMGPAQRNKTVL
jgi:hypothetical protein